MSCLIEDLVKSNRARPGDLTLRCHGRNDTLERNGDSIMFNTVPGSR